jgi:hypothetical protein
VVDFEDQSRTVLVRSTIAPAFANLSPEHALDHSQQPHVLD